MVGGKRQREGSRMMRKTSLILLGAAAGAALTLIATQPRIVFDGSSARAAAADTYRQLSLFGDVFERVRADYVEKPDDAKLIELAINGMLAGPRPAFELHGRQELPRHAGADARRVRRARHRGHDGRRPDQGRRADRRDAGGTRPASWPTTSSPISTASRCRASPSTRRSRRCAARSTPRSSCGSRARAPTSRSR